MQESRNLASYLPRWRKRLPHDAAEAPAATSPHQVDAILAIACEEVDGHARLALTGELDLSNASAFAAQLRKVEEARPDVVEIDLRGLTFIDSSGLTELFAANRRARERNGRVVLVKDHGPIERVLNLACVEDVIDVVEQPT